MKRTALLLALLAAVCAAIAGDSSGAASNYPTPLKLRSTASAVTGSWKLDASTGIADATTGNVPAQSATGWYAFDPGTSSTTQLATIPTTLDGLGWIVDPVGGASGFPAGTWSVTVKTDIPDATLVAGTAVLTVGIWKGTVSGSAFTATGTILTPTDDPGAQDLRSSVSPVTTTVSFSLPKISLAAGETLYIDLWRHQSAGINDATATRRELDLTVNDGVSQITHPAADDTGPSHSLTITAVSGSTYFNSGSSTLYYNGGAVGSIKVNDAITDAGSGPLQVTYPLVATAGWTHANETVATGPSYQSSVYSWTSGSTTSPGAQTITGEDNALQTSTATLTLTNDTTAPSGQTVALSGGPGYSTLSVPLTLGNGADAGAGLDGASGVVERASATLSGGTCGTFGAFASVTLSSNADATVASGNCYRYQYKISDRVANQSAASAPSADAKVDTSAPAVTDTAPTEVTGAGDQYYDAATDTLWFRPAGAGSFTMNATASDAQSGVTQVAFPDVSATSGWTSSTGGTDTTTSYSSPVNYTWTAGATAPGAKVVTATNGTTLTATDTITLSADSTAPTGQTAALSGGPWYTTLSVPLTLGSGTDAGSGIDATRGGVERASAPVTNGTCGTFGSFAAVTLAGGADTTVATGNCYRYQYKASDNVGNLSTASTASADAKVDTTPPGVPTLIFSSLTNAAASASTIYYRPDADGGFTVTAATSDAESGVAGYTFPAIAGLTSAGAGASRTYTFTGTDDPPSDAQSVTAANTPGLASAPASFTFVADAAAPKVTIRCNGLPCSTHAYPKAVAITVTASDGSGAGVDEIRYTTNGSDPTADAGTEYQQAFSVRTVTKVKVRAFDRAGNATKVLTVLVRSLADRLTLSAPARVSLRAGSRYLQARVTTSARAAVTATMTGPGLQKPERWRFVLGTGASIVQLRLPKGLPRSGSYTVVWAAQAGERKAKHTTRVVLGLPRAS